MKDILTNTQAAEVLGIAPQTLHNWRSERRGPDYIKLGRRIVYQIDDLKKYIEKHRIVLDSDR